MANEQKGRRQLLAPNIGVSLAADCMRASVLPADITPIPRGHKGAVVDSLYHMGVH